MFLKLSLSSSNIIFIVENKNIKSTNEITFPGFPIDRNLRSQNLSTIYAVQEVTV